MLIRLSVLLALSLGLSACDGMTTGSATPAEGAAVTMAAPSADGFGGLLNAARAEAGLPAATPDARLAAAAQAFAQDMVARDFFSHTSPDGGTLDSRLSAAGFSQCGAAENIAFGATSPETAYTMWMGSPAHRSNMLFSGNVAYGYGEAGGKAVLMVGRAC